MIDHRKILVIDSGTRECRVVDKILRTCNLKSYVESYSLSLSQLEAKPLAIILTGTFDNDCQLINQIAAENVPVLALSGAVLALAKYLGCQVKKPSEKVNFSMNVREGSHDFLKGLLNIVITMQDDSETIQSLSDDLIALISLEDNIFSFYNEKRNVYAIQLNPTTNLIETTRKVLENFLFEILHIEPKYTLEARLDETINRLKLEIPNNRKIMVPLNGVDSLISYFILLKFVPKENLIGIFIDTGFLKAGEADNAARLFESLGIFFQIIKASIEFSSSCTTQSIEIDTFTTGVLKGKTSETSPPNGKNTNTKIELDTSYTEVRNVPIGPLNDSIVCPEQKKIIINDTFLRIIERKWKELDFTPETFLISQSTLRSDFIEDSCNQKDIRKNQLRLLHFYKRQKKVLEPLIEFYKDELRILGKNLNLDEKILNLPPFSNYGLATRIICATEPYIDKDYQETTSLIKMIAGFNSMSKRPHPLLTKIKLALSEDESLTLMNITADKTLSAHLLPIKCSGMNSEPRPFGYACALSSSEPKPNWISLSFLASIMPKISHHIKRVVYVFGDQVTFPISDVTVTFLRKPIIDTLRLVDENVSKVFDTASLGKVNLLPTILVPFHFDREPTQCNFGASILRSVVVRPFITTDYIFGRSAIPGQDIPEETVDKMKSAALSVPGLSRVLYDLTSSPPAFIEWE